jgi:hypothetical protein
MGVRLSSIVVLIEIEMAISDNLNAVDAQAKETPTDHIEMAMRVD